MRKLSEDDALFLGNIDPHKLKGPYYKFHILFFVIIGFFLIAVIWAKFAVIDEVIRGNGKVIPSRKVQVIQNLEGGIVKKILAKEGMMVKKNQPLLIIDDTQFKANHNENILKEKKLSISFKRLMAEYKKIPFILPAHISSDEKGMYQFELALYEARQDELNELWNSYTLAQSELKMTIPLIKKGAASPVEVLRLKRASSDLKNKINQFNSSTLNELNKVKAELDRLKETNIASQDRLKRTVVLSPTKGIVKQLKIYTEGGVVQPGMDLIEIVPLDDTLLVEARVKPKDIGFLQLGQTANVSITAYDFAVYGSLKGKVVGISADAITNKEKDTTYYLIRVQTKKNYLGSKAKPLYIIPGMQAQVDIQTGKKTILDYILNPITKTIHKAMKEK